MLCGLFLDEKSTLGKASIVIGFISTIMGFGAFIADLIQLTQRNNLKSKKKMKKSTKILIIQLAVIWIFAIAAILIIHSS